MFTLLAYLEQQFPQPNIDEMRPQSRSTTSGNFSYDDITAVHHWDFSPETVRKDFHAELRRERNFPHPTSDAISPQKGNALKQITNEKGILGYYNRAHYVVLNRALIEDTVVDTESGAHPADRVSRTARGEPTLVGEIKPSWIYKSSYDETSRLQVLSQLLSYMHAFEVQHGYILTDSELVAVKRDGQEEYGTIFCSEPVASGGILMALWGLHQLALREPYMARIERPRPKVVDSSCRDGEYTATAR